METKITFYTISNFEEPCKVVIKISTSNLQQPSRDWETLEEVENREVLSICGDMYTGKTYKRFEGCGQIYDCFVAKTPAQKKLVEFWKKHHLNDLKAGTKAQTELLEEYRKTAANTEECKYLEEKGMLVDRGYKYGTSWLCTTFPKEELLTIIQELENENK